MNREIADRSMWVWSPCGEGAKIKSMKIFSRAVVQKFAPAKISHYTVYSTWHHVRTVLTTFYHVCLFTVAASGEVDKLFIV